MSMGHKPTVFVGMSGGVDSSVTAYVLKQQGYAVVGIFMKNWSGYLSTSQGQFRFPCQAQPDYEDAAAVARQLDIPLYTFNFEEEYQKRVIDYFVTEIQAGRTPNPDIMCNKEIKFKIFLEKAQTLGADYIATGHYARISQDKDGMFHLSQGTDSGKDQSYFLATLGQKELSWSIFPLGAYQKEDVRAIAREADLATAAKPDSQGICFVGDIDVNEFIQAFVPPQKGEIVNTHGDVLGEHDGIQFFTVGQRRGLGIGGGMPYYVVATEQETNRVYVAPGMNPPELYQRHVVLTDLVYTREPIQTGKTYHARLRHGGELVPCVASEERCEGELRVEFDTPQRAITPGQYLVFYEGEEVRGSGVMN
ncbi:MAG: tRNA 2-thiouridine(34) synthase MnmA [Parcubacteria group bacterium SW_4_49_11]|nr:MAG: tRNA 2-thiouridine(34) synthase MnmA [Parcubacteria group bacterium SW_4_49_11]